MPLDSVPLDLGSLPGIVCGPVLRRLTRTSVSVWVACLEPDPITLTVRRRGAGAPPPPTSVTSTPTRVGANLWMSVLTAGAPGGTFEPGRIYEYELMRGVGGDAARSRGTNCRCRDAALPTFLAPPDNAAELVVYHTSCRKPHGGGRDGLSLALVDMAPASRPRRRRSRICWSCRATRSMPTRSATR